MMFPHSAVSGWLLWVVALCTAMLGVLAKYPRAGRLIGGVVTALFLAALIRPLVLCCEGCGDWWWAWICF